MRIIAVIAFSLSLLSWVIPSHPQRHFAPMSAQMETAIHSYDEKYLFTRTAASYSPGEYMGIGVTSDGFGFVVTDAVGLFCNSTISSGSGTPNLIGTSTQMVLAVNNLHNGDWLDINGHVWFGGQQCGNPYITGTNVYEANLDSAGTDETFTTIANGWNANDGEEGYTIGVTTTGKLMICGDTRNGARGNGTAGADLQKWVQIPLATNIVPRKVYAGFAQFVICDTTTSGGTVIGQRIYSWSTTIGHASSLGYGSPSFGAGASSISTYNVPTEILIGGQHAHNILCIAGGLDCNYMLFDSAISGRADSVRLLAWGTYGWRMCHTTVAGGTDPLNTPTDITAKIMTPTVIAAASSHTIDTVVVDNGSSHILIGDGSIRVLAGWGSSEQGTLGNGMQLNFATTSTPYNDGGQDEYLGAVVQMTPVIICPTKANWKTLTSTMYYGYFNQYSDQNGNWFFCGRYKTYVAPLGVHSGDFTTGNLSSVMNCGWIFSNFVQQYDAFANTAALSIGQGCSNACVSGPTSNSQCSAISVTCSAIHAGISVTSSSTTAYLTGASSTYAGTRLMHMKFYVDGAAAPNIMDNPVTQTDTAKGLSLGSHTAKVVITGQYYEADSATFSFTISASVQTGFYFSASGTSTTCTAPGTSTSCPALQIAAIMPTLAPGDTAYFNRGDGFAVDVAASVSGTSGHYIVLTGYGTGPDPVLGGMPALSFTNISGSLWSAPWTGPNPTLLTINGVLASKSRTPNQLTGYKTFVPASSSTTDIHDATNAIHVHDTLVGRTSAFTIDLTISTAVTSTDITVSPALTFNNIGGNGYFRIGDLPDSATEWRDTANTIQTFAASTPTGYAVPAVGVPLTITGNWVKVSGLKIMGGDTADIVLSGDSCVITSDSVMDAMDGIQMSSAVADSITNCYLAHFGNNAIFKSNTSNFNDVVTGNTVVDQGMIPGMGRSGDLTQNYCAIIAGDSGSVIKHNFIDHTGYIAIATYGSGFVADSNLIKDFCQVKADGAAVYTWMVGLATFARPRAVKGNVVKNGANVAAAFAGTTLTNSQGASAVYDDNYTGQVNASYNVSHNVNGPAFFDHGANNSFTNNSADSSGYCDFLAAEVGPVITGLTVEHNNFLSGATGLPAVRVTTINNDLSTFGVIDLNNLVGTIGLTSPFWTFSTGASDPGTFRTPVAWTSDVGYDAHSIYQTGRETLYYNFSASSNSFSLWTVFQDLTGILNKTGSVTIPAYGCQPYLIWRPGYLTKHKVGRYFFN